jgi:hypothetical protein
MDMRTKRKHFVFHPPTPPRPSGRVAENKIKHLLSVLDVPPSEQRKDAFFYFQQENLEIVRIRSQTVFENTWKYMDAKARSKYTVRMQECSFISFSLSFFLYLFLYLFILNITLTHTLTFTKTMEKKKRLEEDSKQKEIKLSAFEKGLDISFLTLLPTKVKREFGVFRKHKQGQNERYQVEAKFSISKERKEKIFGLGFHTDPVADKVVMIANKLRRLNYDHEQIKVIILTDLLSYKFNRKNKLREKKENKRQKRETETRQESPALNLNGPSPYVLAI